jgi:hypothetical protein
MLWFCCCCYSCDVAAADLWYCCCRKILIYKAVQRWRRWDNVAYCYYCIANSIGRWNKKYKNTNKYRMKMDCDEINLLGYKLMKIKITQVERCSNLFLVLGWERREKSHCILAIVREKYHWHRFRLLKWSMFVSNSFIWWEKFILGFFTLKVHEKRTFKIGLIFGFGLILVLGISFWFFEVINKFITISKVFWVKNI